MEIGYAILKFERSEFERNRIRSSVLGKSGRCWEIFDKYAEKIDDIEFWTKIHGHLKIKGGFRPGVGKAKELVIRSVLDGLQKQDLKVETAFWNLYRRCVQACSFFDHKELDKLMSTNEIDGNPDSPQDIFKSIIKYADLFNVRKESLEDLYEIYWFNRFENFQEIISNRQLSFEVVTKLINKSKSELETSINKSEIEIKNLLKRVELIESTDKNDNFINEIKKLELKVESQSVSVQNQLSNIVSGEIKSIKTKIDKSLNEKNSEPDLDSIKALEKKLLNKIREVELSLNSKAIDLVKESLGSPTKVIHKKDSISLDSISFSKNISMLMPGVSPSKELDIVLAAILKSSQVFIFPSVQIAQSLLDSFYKNNLVQSVCAAPSWLAIEDLKESIGDQNQLSGKILVIQNFDLGYVDSYLLPFMATVNSFGDSFRLVLIPSSDCRPSILSKVLGSVVMLDEEFIQRLEQELKGKSFDTSDVLIQDLNQMVAVDKNLNDLRMLIQNSDIKLNDDIFQKFCLHHLLVKKIIEHPRSLLLAYNLILEKYISARYGTAKKDITFGRIRGLLEF